MQIEKSRPSSSAYGCEACDQGCVHVIPMGMANAFLVEGDDESVSVPLTGEGISKLVRQINCASVFCNAAGEIRFDAVGRPVTSA